MWEILIFICCALTNLSSSSSSNSCSINIDEFENETDIQHKTSMIDVNQFLSSWQRETDDDDDHSDLSNMIQINFTIPYDLTTNSILNQTIFIFDASNNQLLANSSNICRINSTFYLNYTTIRPLPHQTCLYVLLNLSISKEILFCRTIENSSNATTNVEVDGSHVVGPSEFFILSQCIIIFIMMMTIYSVQTAREKQLANRISQRVIQSRPYKMVFRTKAVQRSSTHIADSATTLKAGLNQLKFHRNMSIVDQPVEEQVLAATDLTATASERRATHLYLNRDLIDVKEFTKRMSVQQESSSDPEPSPA